MQHTCSLCGTVYEFVWEKGTPLPENFPFCSARCKTVDLGKWLNEEYAISTPVPVPVVQASTPQSGVNACYVGSETELGILTELGINVDDDSEG